MEKGSRPIRSRKNSRRSWTPTPSDGGNRPLKRLFTPEIKRMLKEWLVRRRENPYPSREEKKALAHQTGLTYIQICNWFANWRRKLKNAGKEPTKNTWGHLIKNYNNNAHGNVEQFSICSSDSIWEDEERRAEYFERKFEGDENAYNKFIEYGTNRMCITDDDKLHLRSDRGYEGKIYLPNEQCYQVSSTTNMNNNNDNNLAVIKTNDGPMMKNSFNAKYKNQIMEKYLRGLDTDSSDSQPKKHGMELSKWLESTAKFTPDKNNYIEWNCKSMRSKGDEYSPTDYSDEINPTGFHEKEELDAAEALTFLAGNCKSQWVK